jgi:mono/diheme cytochrome c family protein
MNDNRSVKLAAVAAALVSALLTTAAARADNLADDASRPSVERGRYLAKTAGCNDCHTAGYAPTGGRVPESQWLKGDSLGWRGPWGTTYPSNVRILLGKITEDDWVAYARATEMRPPMPWFALRDMTESDLRSIYRFVRSLGAPGDAAPTYVPPDAEPKGPYILFPSEPPAAEPRKVAGNVN